MFTSTIANVRAFGAKADGSDDSAAIQAAIDAADVIYIPAGTYLLGTGLTLRSGVTLYGEGALSVLQPTVDALRVLSGTSLSNIAIKDLAINGGGQTTDIYTGVKGVIGIYLNAVTDFTIANVGIQYCGVANESSPTSDGGFGGFGILVEARDGESRRGRIENCVVSHIAGGGNFAGDGIYIAGQNETLATTASDISVVGCRVSTTGRHCYTLASDGGLSVPRNIVFDSCVAEASALCGIDFENGQESQVLACRFAKCGNDQTYFDPVLAYGATFRLCAGVAVGNEDLNISLSLCTLQECYYGVTYGAIDGLSISSTQITDSVVSDLCQSLGNSPARFRLTDVVCHTASDFMLAYSTDRSDAVIQGCDFEGRVRVAATRGMLFDSCVFRGGFEIVGDDGARDVLFAGCVFREGFEIAGENVARLTWSACTFEDFAGAGISVVDQNQLTTACDVLDCRFLGTGNMTYGVFFDYRSALNWRIERCTFLGQTQAGIHCTNSDGAPFVSSVQQNTFDACANGVVVPVSGITDAAISSNTFLAVTGWCIDFAAINSTGAFTGNIIANNLAGASVVNGIRIAKSTGDGDYCNILGNNWHNCSGTKASINITNASGYSANNITV